MLSSIFVIFCFIQRELFILFYLGKILSDMTLFDAFNYVMHTNTMCKFSLSQRTSVLY